MKKVAFSGKPHSMCSTWPISAFNQPTTVQRVACRWHIMLYMIILHTDYFNGLDISLYEHNYCRPGFSSLDRCWHY